MNAKLLTDEALERDLDTELMFMVGCLASTSFTGPPTSEAIRSLVKEQLNLLLPTVKRHIKRHVKATKERTDLVATDSNAITSLSNPQKHALYTLIADRVNNLRLGSPHDLLKSVGIDEIFADTIDLPETEAYTKGVNAAITEVNKILKELFDE